MGSVQAHQDIHCGPLIVLLFTTRQLVIRRYIGFIQSLKTSKNQVISTLSNWAVKTVRSNTGFNLFNIRNEFENIELLANLLQQREEEMDPDIVLQLDIVIINNVCTR